MSNMTSLFFFHMFLLCLYCAVSLANKRKDSDCSGCTEDCEIAYAYDSSNPSRNLCLLEFSDNEDWGFSVLNFEFDSFLDSNDEELTLDLYAGATNCDLNNGIIVGEVVLTYSADPVDTLTMAFQADEPFYFKQVNGYAGLDILATLDDGVHTTIVDKFPSVYANETGFDTYAFDIFPPKEDMDKRFNIVAHATVDKKQR